VDAETRNGALKLSVQKFGQAHPLKLEICRDRDRRTSTAKKAARGVYQRLLHRVLQRAYPGYTIDKLTSSADLEHSFGPAHARAVLRKGRSAFAVIGINGQEIQSSIDAALTVGLLWLNLCRREKRQLPCRRTKTLSSARYLSHSPRADRAPQSQRCQVPSLRNRRARRGHHRIRHHRRR